MESYEPYLRKLAELAWNSELENELQKPMEEDNQWRKRVTHAMEEDLWCSMKHWAVDPLVGVVVAHQLLQPFFFYFSTFSLSLARSDTVLERTKNTPSPDFKKHTTMHEKKNGQALRLLQKTEPLESTRLEKDGKREE